MQAKEALTVISVLLEPEVVFVVKDFYPRLKIPEVGQIVLVRG